MSEFSTRIAIIDKRNTPSQRMLDPPPKVSPAVPLPPSLPHVGAVDVIPTPPVPTVPLSRHAPSPPPVSSICQRSPNGVRSLLTPPDRLPVVLLKRSPKKHRLLSLSNRSREAFHDSELWITPNSDGKLFSDEIPSNKPIGDPTDSGPWVPDSGITSTIK